MPEQVPNNEDPFAGLTDEQAEMYREFLDKNSESDTKLEKIPDFEERVNALEESFSDFEYRFDINALLAITDPDEAMNSPERKSAKFALRTMVEDLKFLQEQTSIPKNKYEVI